MSEALEVTGIIKSVGEVQLLGEKQFAKMEFVIESEGEYPTPYKMELLGDKVDEIGKFAKVGERKTVGYNIRGRYWTNKEGKEVVFNSFNAWRINTPKDDSGQNSAQDQAEMPMDEDDSNLPF